MAQGVYGTVRPSLITYNDIDIFYHYQPSRNSENTDTNFKNGFVKYSQPSELFETTIDTSTNEILPGIYNLKLPSNIFSAKGIYTIYIKPKEIETTINDVGNLTAYPDIRGIILDMSKIENSNELKTNGSLVGWRVEYFNNNTRLEDFKIITSNNKCEPTNQNVNNSNQKAITYIYNDSSDLMFCTVTPSTSLSFNSATLPNIGTTGQKVKLINTKFNPLCIEIEMVENDADTIATMVNGSQLRNMDTGLITTYNGENEIFNQHEYGVIKDGYTNKPLYNFKIIKEDIDFTQDINEVLNQ